MTRIRLLAAAVMMLCSLPVFAAKIALLIGNAGYEKASRLDNPVRDAELLARVLKNELGFDDVQIVRNAGKRQMELALATFTRASAGADVAFLYYSGHGMQPSTGGKSFLLPINADIGNDAELEVDGVSVERMVDELERMPRPAKVRVVVLDACRNSPFGRRVKGDVKGLAPVKPVDQYTLVGYATNDGEVAQDGSGANSPYAQSLARWLGKAGQMPLRRIFEQTAREVRAATGQQQRPRTYGDLPSDVLLSGEVVDEGRPVVADPLPKTDDDERAWAEAKSMDTMEGYQAYLEAHPSGRFVKFAQAAKRKKEGQQVRAAYEAAQRSGTVEGWQEFLAAYGQGEFRDRARSAMEALEREQARRRDDYSPGKAFRDCGECPEMVAVPGGNFEMGSPAGEAGRQNDEGPVHRVTVKKFALGKHEVTKGEFRRYVSETGRTVSGCRVYDGKEWKEDKGRSWENPGYSQGEDHPVVCVSWEDAKGYAQWLSRKSGKEYRLASEAEWEYAARAGSRGMRYWGDGEQEGCGYANVADQSGKRKFNWGPPLFDCDDGYAETAPVGSYRENGYGLKDMLGNVWEWTEDCWNESYGGAPSDGTAWTVGNCSRRVGRGGAWGNGPAFVRSAFRGGFDSTGRSYGLGFRLARTLP